MHYFDDIENVSRLMSGLGKYMMRDIEEMLGLSSTIFSHDNLIIKEY